MREVYSFEINTKRGSLPTHLTNTGNRSIIHVFQVDLFDVSDTYKAWSILPEEEGVSMHKLPIYLTDTDPVVFSVPDPRLPTFSNRLILMEGISGKL